MQTLAPDLKPLDEDARAALARHAAGVEDPALKDVPADAVAHVDAAAADLQTWWRGLDAKAASRLSSELSRARFAQLPAATGTGAGPDE